MGLAAGIIIIFIIMVAFFISYGKAFRIKNEIINVIEQQEGMTLDDLKDFVVGKSTAYVGRKMGVCYNKIERTTPTSEYIGFTMEVVVFMEMDKTILGEAFNVKIPVTGETKLIEKGNIYDDLSLISDISECGTGPSKSYTSIQ